MLPITDPYPPLRKRSADDGDDRGFELLLLAGQRIGRPEGQGRDDAEQRGGHRRRHEQDRLDAVDRNSERPCRRPGSADRQDPIAEARAAEDIGGESRKEEPPDDGDVEPLGRNWPERINISGLSPTFSPTPSTYARPTVPREKPSVRPRRKKSPPSVTMNDGSPVRMTSTPTAAP